LLFNSAIFFVFFIGVYFLYWWVIKKHRLWLLLIAGCVFYGSWDWRFLILLCFTSGIDFVAAKKIYAQTNKLIAKRWLIASISFNLVTLGFFKYFNFFTSSFSELTTLFGFKSNTLVLNLILPVGISFYTFQAMAYVTDVYRNKIKPEQSALHYFTFICFFPQMVAGPIERAKNMLPQFHKEKKWSRNNFESGLNLLAYGFFKKVVIADNLALLTDSIHSDITAQSSFTLFIGVFAFAVQIYADFSGYTDIARGCARLIGFRLSRNFYFPYFATTFRQFWKRWHMSLSTWFRDYLYIPLGGNKSSVIKRNINLVLTFIISGFWHGANLTFILWGFFHGLALIIEKQFSTLKWSKILSHFFVFLIVAYLFTLFRSIDIKHFMNYTSGLFSFNRTATSAPFPMPESNVYFLIPLVVFLGIEIKNALKKGLSIAKNQYVINLLLFVLILLFSVFENAPSFIYFQF
jgi:alginate O-acetyltransferase complex protein AlgI